MKTGKRSLGRTGMETSPFGFGGNVFGWTADEKTSFALLDAFVDEGYSLIDTADVYSCWVPGHQGGESETLIGRWLKKSGKRNKILIATKVGLDFGPGKPGNLTKAYIERSIEQSLARLQTDHVDLYQAHRDDPNTPMEETLSALGAIVKAGKARAIGASNFTAARLREALDLSRKLGLPRYETLQPLYNLYDREEFERELLPLCQREEIGVINFYSLAAGFLTGKYRSQEDLTKGDPRRRGSASRYLNEKGLRVLQALDAVAEKLDASPAQVSLAWLMAQPAITAPLASATSIAQLQELFGAARLELDPESLRLLRDCNPV